MIALVEPSYRNLTTLMVGFVCLFFYSLILHNYIQIIVFVIQKLFYLNILNGQVLKDVRMLWYQIHYVCFTASLRNILVTACCSLIQTTFFSKQIANVNAKTQLTSKRMTPQPLHPPANMCFTISILNMINGHHLDYCKVANAFVIQ